MMSQKKNALSRVALAAPMWVWCLVLVLVSPEIGATPAFTQQASQLVAEDGQTWVAARKKRRRRRNKRKRRAKAKAVTPETPIADPALAPMPDTKVAMEEMPAADPYEGIISADLLIQAQGKYDALALNEVVERTESLLARDDLTTDQQILTLKLQGASYAIMGRGFAAEKAFQRLLRLSPDFNYPEKAAPRILAVFRKVRAEYDEVQAQKREAERQKIIATLKVEGAPTIEGPGGTPIRFDYQLEDPTAAVSSLQLSFRREGDQDFSSLALSKAEDGTWSGEIPGEMTQSEEGLNLEYFVSLNDTEEQPLLRLGNPLEPQGVAVEAGMITRYYETWWFWTIVSVGVAGAGVGGYLGLQAIDDAQSAPQNDVSVALGRP